MGNDYNDTFMDEHEKEFFENYSSALKQQETIIAEQHEMQIDDREFEILIRNLEIIKEEYVVEGALLECTKGISESREVTYEGEVIESKPIRVEENSRLKINEDRVETINDFIPANVEDCKGGMRDFGSDKVNIISFGNCSDINEKDLSKLISAANLKDKESEIVDAIKAGKGLCYCFMNLNDEWENLAMAGEYMTGMDQVPCAGIAKVFASPSYMKFNGKEGINMLSMLFCPYGGGIITAKESGQHVRMKKLLDDVTGVQERNGRVWTDEEMYIAKYMTLKMLNQGYSLEIIAGMIGNVINEGKPGYFESSAYKNLSKKPDYLVHMDSKHAYNTLVSGKMLTDVGTNALILLKNDNGCLAELHMFGLGTNQWTGARGEKLIKKYIDKFGNNAFPTKEECAEIEVDFMLEELDTTFATVIDNCINETMGKGNEEKIDIITRIIMDDYEVPSVRNLNDRQDSANAWYDVLTGK